MSEEKALDYLGTTLTISGNNKTVSVLSAIKRSPNSLGGTTTTLYGEALVGKTRLKTVCYSTLTAREESIAKG